MSFSPSQAAFEGFRFIRERPQSVTLWMAAILLLNLATAAFRASPWALPLGELREVVQSHGPKVGPLLELAPRLIPSAILSFGLSMAGLCIIAPSILRAMLRADRKTVLRLGMDEARMLGLFLAVVGIIFAVAVVFGVVLGSLAGLTARFGIGGLFIALASLVTLLLPFFVTLRLSLAAPMAVATHHLDLKAAWKLTRGVFWRLAWALLLALLLFCAVWLAAALVTMSLAATVVFVTGGTWEGFTGWLKPQHPGLLAQFAPGPLLVELMDSALAAILGCVLVGAVVSAYRSLTGAAPVVAAPAEKPVFD
jgi:hypothetical protein